MKFTFEEFIEFFNKLSKIFYSELLGTSRKLRYFQSVFTDKEFEKLSSQLDKDKKPRKDSVNGKFAIELKPNVYLKLFTVDALDDMYGCKETSMFEDGQVIISIYVPQQQLDCGSNEELHTVYSSIFNTVLKSVYGEVLWINFENPNSKSSLEDFLSEPRRVSMGKLLAHVIVEAPYKYEEIKPLVQGLLSYSKPNMDYIQLIPSQDLKSFIDDL